MSDKAEMYTGHDWEARKSELRLLYLEKNLPLPKVSKIMEQDHNFFAKKNQYEKYFGRWGWTKNRSQEFWRHIAAVKRERELRGVASEFYDLGKKISEKQIQRYTKRYSNLGSIHRASSRGLPPGIAVCSPQSGQTQSMERALPMISALPPDHIQFFTVELPFHLFENSFSAERTQLGRRSEAWSTMLDDPLTIDPRILTQSREFDAIRSQHPEDEEAAPTNDAGRIMVDLNEKSTSQTGTVRGPILMAMDSIMPPKCTGISSCDSLMQLDSRIFSSPLHRMILFSVSNNFAGIGASSVAEVLRYLEKETKESLYRFIFSSQGHSPGAITRNLFRAAIEAGNARTVDLLLSEQLVGIDPNTEVCYVQGTKFTPIERASDWRHEATIRTLLKHKADVNRTFLLKEDHFLCRGALEYAVRSFGKEEVLDQGIFQLLLDAGGKLGRPTLGRIIIRGYDEFFMALMSKHAHEDHAQWSEWGIFRDVVLNMQDQTSMAMVEKLIEVRADLNHRDHRFSRIRSFRPVTLIDAAAQRGNLELVNTLVSHEVAPTGNTLPCAIISGNLDLIQKLLGMGLDVNSLGSLDVTPLAAAIRSKSPQLRNLLIDKGALDCLKDKTHFCSALDAASEVGDVKFIEYLIHLGANVIVPEQLGVALCFVAKEGTEEAAKVLIDYGAELNYSRDPSTALLKLHEPLHEPLSGALSEALKRRHLGLVRMLLHANASPDIGLSIMHAVRWGERSVIKALIFAGANVFDTPGAEEPPLTLAVEQKDQGLVELLLEAGADVNNPRAQNSGHTALNAAAANGDIQMARYLLSQGADPHDSTALNAAACSNRELFELLLNKHMERYPMGRKGYGSDVLKTAIKAGDESTARTLLEKEADPNAILPRFPKDGTSAFGYAIMKQKNTTVFVEMCLQAKCDPNGIVAQARIGHGYPITASRITALLAAVGTRSTSIVELLIERGAQVNIPASGPVKRTPLQRAAEIGSMSMVQLLLRHGADIHAPSAPRGGGTALQLAAIGGYIPIVCTLMSLQADVNAPASKFDGRTALEGASEHGRLDTVQILLNGGAGFKEKGQGQLKC